MVPTILARNGVLMVGSPPIIIKSFRRNSRCRRNRSDSVRMLRQALILSSSCCHAISVWYLRYGVICGPLEGGARTRKASGGGAGWLTAAGVTAKQNRTTKNDVGGRKLLVRARELIRVTVCVLAVRRAIRTNV